MTTLLSTRLSLVFRAARRMKSNLVESNLRNGVFIVEINNAARRNCVNHAVARGLVAAFDEFENTPAAKIAILHGKGGTFSAGYDLKEVSSGDYEKIDPEFLQKYRFLGPTAMELSKPLIAAVEGHAVAGGLELALFADLRVAGRSSVFGVFCRRVGVPLIDGGTVRLPRIIGSGRAMDIVLTGREVRADEALQIGLVNRLVDDGQVLAESIRLAESIIAHPYECMLTDRRSLIHGLSHPFRESIQYEYEHGVNILSTSIRGAKAFMDSKKSKL